MLKLCRVTKVKVLFLVLVYVFNFVLFEFSAAILEKGLLSFSFCLSVTYLYEMGTPLPCATLAVAVGWWECKRSRNADTANGVNLKVPVTCRLFAPPSLIDSAAGELLGYAPKFLEASCELLGPYPFRRLDMLILPKCFACMGLKRLVKRGFWA